MIGKSNRQTSPQRASVHFQCFMLPRSANVASLCRNFEPLGYSLRYSQQPVLGIRQPVFAASRVSMLFSALQHRLQSVLYAQTSSQNSSVPQPTSHHPSLFLYPFASLRCLKAALAAEAMDASRFLFEGRTPNAPNADDKLSLQLSREIRQIRSDE
jgi:hypothetical protein